jgi:hypothetical protein
MCMAPAHHLAGFATGAALATAAHQPVWVAVASACLASVTAGGVLSPDVDQFKVWRALDRWLPDEWLGEGGPLQHRGLSHWWGIPAGVAAWLYVSGGPWWAWMLLAGWVSHLVADWAFGQAGVGSRPRHPAAAVVGASRPRRGRWRAARAVRAGSGAGGGGPCDPGVAAPGAAGPDGDDRMGGDAVRAVRGIPARQA